jgi:hypothetical protein
VDLNLRSSNWWKEQSISWHSFYMTTQDENQSSDDVMGTHFTLPNYPFRASGHWFRTGEDFEPALGFVRRRGGQSVGVGFTYYFDQPDREWLEDLSMGADYDRYQWLDGGLDSEELEWNVIGIRTLEGDYVGFEVEFEREILRESFEIIDALVVPVDEYRGIDFELEFRSSSDRYLFGGIELAYGDYYGGSSTRGEIELSWRPSRFIQLDGEIDSTLARLPQEDFEAVTGSLGLRVTPTTKLSFNGIAQYDNRSETIGLNFRIRYIIQSGSDLFLVLNKGFERKEEGDRRSFRTTKTEAVAKLGWTFQF